MYLRICIVTVVASVCNVSGADHNATLEGVNGAKIAIGLKLKADEKIRVALQAQCGNLQPGLSRSMHVTVPFNTEGLSAFVDCSQKSAEFGVSVSYYSSTRMLRKPEGKKTIDSLAGTGLAYIHNSVRIHNKMVGFFNERINADAEFSEEQGLSGVVYLGSSNIGSKNAAEKNEECLVELTDAESLYTAKKIFEEDYAMYCQTYDGGDINHTPKKDKQKRDEVLQQSRKVGSFSSPSQLTDTTRDKLAETRATMVQNSAEIYLETMTGFPTFLKSIPDDVPVSIIVDHTAIRPYEKEWDLLAQRPHTRITVRVSPGSSHHAKVVAVRKKEDGTVKDMIEVGSANFTETSAEDYNGLYRTVVKTISPLKERHNKIHSKGQEPSSPFVSYSPTGKRLRDRLPEPRSAKKRKTGTSTSTVTTSPVKVIKRKLSFGD